MLGGLWLSIAVLIAAVGGLWIGARLFVDNAADLARGLGVSELVIGLTVVAIGTSLPELVVTVGAALAGTGDVAVGNVHESHLS